MMNEQTGNKPCTNCANMFTHTVYIPAEKEEEPADDGWPPIKEFSKWEKFFIRFFVKFLVYTAIFTLLVAMPFSVIELEIGGFWSALRAYSIAFREASVPTLVTIGLTALVTATATVAVMSRRDVAYHDD